MSIACQHGFAITFANGGSYRLQNVDGVLEQSIDTGESTHHGSSTHRTFYGCDLINSSNPVVVQVQFESAVGLPELSGTPQLVTFTLPKPKNHSAGATIAGSAIVTNRKFPSGAAGSAELMIGEFTIVFTSDPTPPAFTPATTT